MEKKYDDVFLKQYKKFQFLESYFWFLSHGFMLSTSKAYEFQQNICILLAWIRTYGGELSQTA